MQAEVLTPARSIAALSSSEPMLQFTNENEILQDIRETSAGKNYIQNYPAWVAKVNRLSPVTDLKVLIQLSIVADQMRCAGPNTMCRSLSALAHIGLDLVVFSA